jgi:hypothetical protein
MKAPVLLGAAIVALMLFASPGSARADEAPATSPPASTPAASSAPAAATTEPPPATGKRTVWPWVIMGTGVGLIITAIVLEVNAVREDDKRESDEVKLTALPSGDPGRKPLETSIKDHEESASSGRTASLIVGTVGFLAVAGSVVLWFVEGSSSSPAPAAKLKPSLTPSFGPTYAGAMLGASF